MPQIPRRETPLEFATYAPLADAPAPPDVVLVRANARQAMMLSEAAGMAGISHAEGLLGRPTRAAVSEAIRSRRAVLSVCCIGNRVYTGLGDDELYAAVPGRAIEKLVAMLETTVRANCELEAFHRGRIAADSGRWTELPGPFTAMMFVGVIPRYRWSPRHSRSALRSSRDRPSARN